MLPGRKSVSRWAVRPRSHAMRWVPTFWPPSADVHSFGITSFSGQFITRRAAPLRTYTHGLSEMSFGSITTAAMAKPMPPMATILSSPQRNLAMAGNGLRRHGGFTARFSDSMPRKGVERFPLASNWPVADKPEGSRLRVSAAESREGDMLDTRAGFDAA